MTEPGRVLETDIASALGAVQSQAESLLTSLRMGGLGASTLAETLLANACALNSQVSWGEEPTADIWSAVRDDNNLVIMAGLELVSITRYPCSVTISRSEPFQSLGLNWSQSGSLSVEWLSEDSDESWVISSGGSCTAGDDFVAVMEQKMEAIEAQEPNAYQRPPPGLPRPDSEMSDWLGDFAGVLPSLVKTAAVAVAGAAVAKASTRATAPKKDPKEPSQATVNCSQCQKKCPTEALFCPFCGNKMELKPTCQECGAELVKEAKFCAQCGAKVPEAIPVCQCGRTFQESEAFCPNCGEKRL